MYRYVNLITDTAHKIYWTPIAFDMVPIHNNYFATIPVADWFFYPYFAMIRSYFSRTEPNMFLAIGPPMKLLKAPPYPGKVIVDIGLYLKYRSPLFGKLSFSRNGKEY
jgi:hypothetical protein